MAKDRFPGHVQPGGGQMTAGERASNAAVKTSRATERQAQSIADQTVMTEASNQILLSILDEFKTLNVTLAAIEMNTRPPGGGPP